VSLFAPSAFLASNSNGETFTRLLCWFLRFKFKPFFQLTSLPLFYGNVLPFFRFLLNFVGAYSLWVGFKGCCFCYPFSSLLLACAFKMFKGVYTNTTEPRLGNLNAFDSNFTSCGVCGCLLKGLY